MVESAILAPGEWIADGYEVVAHMSRGRRIDVYDVWSHARAARSVFKTPKPDEADNASTVRGLIAEGRLLRRLTHPGIVRCYETVTTFHPPRPGLVLETLTGATLSHLIDECDPMSTDDVLWLGLHLSSAVGYLHSQGMLHLDVKPSNIIAENGRAKLIDLGLARRPGRSARIAGTREYMAPEQARGEDLTSAVDVWAVGLVLYESIVQKSPWPPPPHDDYHPQLEMRVPSLLEREGVPEPLARILDRSLDPDPELRATLSDLRAALIELAPVDPKTHTTI